MNYAGLFLALFVVASCGAAEIPSSPALQVIVDRAAQAALAEFREQKLKPSQLAITLVDLRDSAQPQQARQRV